MRRGLPALLLALALGPGAAVAAAETVPSPEERQRLTRGEVVFRAGAAPRNGAVVPGARGGVAFVRVPTGPEPIWTILTMPRRYPEIFSGLRTVEVLEEQSGMWLLRTDGKFGPFTFRYHTRYEIRADARTITWRLDPTRENDVFEDTWGSWQLVAEDGATLIVYAIGSIPSTWQPLAGYFERRGIIEALGALRDAAIRRAASPDGPAQP